LLFSKEFLGAGDTPERTKKVTIIQEIIWIFVKLTKILRMGMAKNCLNLILFNVFLVTLVK
jgi:hypothetical protein